MTFWYFLDIIYLWFRLYVFLMPETPKLNVDTWGQVWLPQVDNFSKELSDFLLDEKLTNKEQISNFLVSNPDLKTWFEEFLKTANNVQKLKCKKELKNCNTEEEIKSIILENLPEWYKVWSTGVWGDVEITEIPVEDEDIWNLKEQKNQDIEQADQDKEWKQDTVEQLDSFGALNKSLEERDNLLASHFDKYKAAEIDKKTREKAELAKQKLPEETKNQLKEKGYDENFIDNYLLVKVTLNEVKNDSSFTSTEIANFEQSVLNLDSSFKLSNRDIILKNIDNACNISDTSLSSFDKKNIDQTRTELFHETVWNEGLRIARDNNLKSRDYSEVFPEMWEDDMFIKYWQFLEGDLKKYWDEYKNNYLWFINYYHDVSGKKSQGQILTKEEEEFLKLPSMIRWIKKEMDNNTKNMIEELCIISQIKWMYMCMWKWENFNLNKANEIESENWVLTLRWHIDWVDFAIRQDTTKESPLQTSSKLAKDKESADDMDKNNDFILWSNDKFVNSNFILPTQNEIFDAITKTVALSDPIEKFNNPTDYLENLQTNIMWNMEKEYENTKYVHHYMQDHVKWEKIIGKTISFVEKLKGASIGSRINNSNVQLYDFLNLMNFNIKYSTSVEKDNLYKIMDKIDSMASLAQDDSFDWELSNHQDRFAQYLTWASLLNTRKILYGNVVEWESARYAFDLFKNYENLSDERKIWGLHMINFDQMLIDLNKVEIQQKEEKEKIEQDLVEFPKLNEDLEDAYA